MHSFCRFLWLFRVFWQFQEYILSKTSEQIFFKIIFEFLKLVPKTISVFTAQLVHVHSDQVWRIRRVCVTVHWANQLLIINPVAPIFRLKVPRSLIVRTSFVSSRKVIKNQICAFQNTELWYLNFENLLKIYSKSTEKSTQNLLENLLRNLLKNLLKSLQKIYWKIYWKIYSKVYSEIYSKIWVHSPNLTFLASD